MSVLSAFESFMTDPLAKLRVVFASEPVVKDVIRAGPAAFKAFMQNAPDISNHLQDLANAIKKASGNSAPATEEEVAAVSSHVVGMDPPGWVSDETKRWLDHASAGSAAY